MKRKGVTALIPVVALLVVLLLAGFAITQADFLGSTVGVGDDCSFEPYELDGQQFSTLEDAKTTYRSLGGQNWEQVKENANLQVQDGVVKARVCKLE